MRALYSIFLTILLGCNHNQVDNHIFKVFSDTTQRFGLSDHDRHQKLTDAVSLPRIDKGVDSFELRLWSSMAMTNIATITILKFQDSVWQLTETSYWEQPVTSWNEKTKFQIDSLVTRKIVPNISFNAIMDSIEKFRLDTIPTQRKIPGFRNQVGDGMQYVIEISTKHYYERLAYDNPFHYRDDYDKQVSGFLKFAATNLKAFVMD